MKNQFFRGKTRFLKSGLLAAATVLLSGLFVTSNAQTIDIGPNQYAFQYTVDPDFGLFFNATETQYEFRNNAANPIFAFNANTGAMKTDLTFTPGSDYLVGGNRYAFRFSGNPNYGLVFNSTSQRYEFRNGGAAAIFTVNANTGQVVASSTISAPGGNSSLWNAAYNWGNHATEGYLTNETDPQVGALSTDNVPRWSGTQLVNSGISDNPTTGVLVTGGFNGSTSASSFRVGTSTTYTALDNNEIQAYSSGSQGLLYLNFWGGDINFGNNTMWMDRADKRFGLNTSTPTAKLDVNGETGNTENLVNVQVNYDASSVDIRGIRSESVTAPGFGYGIEAIGGYRGVYGRANATTYTGFAYGVIGSASGSDASGTRIGLYGSAFGGATNWAVYSSGNTYVSGDLRIGNTSDVPGYRLSVDGNIIAEELKVQNSSAWPDYVFADDYELMNLNALEDYIATEKHLPGIPSAAEIDEAEGFELGEMQRRTIEKLEELTLYIIELKKENEELKNRIETLEK